MGYQAIVAKRAEFEKRQAALNTFVDAIQQIQKLMAALNEAHAKYVKGQEELHHRVSSLDTMGLKAFEDYRNHTLTAIATGGMIRTLPTDPLKAAVAEAKKAADDQFQKWVDSQSASFPKELKKGMVFKEMKTNILVEVAADPSGIEHSFDSLVHYPNGKTLKSRQAAAFITPGRGYKYTKV